MVMVVTCTAVPCSRKAMKLMMPKRARKSPKMLINWAVQMVRKPDSRKTLVGGTACGSDVIRMRRRPAGHGMTDRVRGDGPTGCRRDRHHQRDDPHLSL